MDPAVTLSALHDRLDTATFDAFFQHCIQRRYSPGAASAASPWLHSSAPAAAAAPASGQSLSISLRR